MTKFFKRNRSIEDILAPLQAILNDLEVHAYELDDKAITGENEAKRLLAETEWHKTNAAKARKVAKNMGVLLD
jgi:hypothetical protein